MGIGELAEAAGVNPKTIRYYEEVGLLPRPRREANGYRRYDEDDLERLVFIRRAQQLELRLDEIREILALRESQQRPCDYVLQVADERIADLDDRIAAMQRTRDELHALLSRAQRLPATEGSYCGLIEHEPQPVEWAEDVDMVSERMTEAGVRGVLVTSSDGRLLGVFAQPAA